jgi:hypothetical protein
VRWLSPRPPIDQYGVVLSRVRRRWVQLATAFVAAWGATAGCTDDPTSALLVFQVEDETYRPEFILFGWRAPAGGGLDDLRLPEQGALPARGRLGSVHIRLRDDQPGVRVVQARGMRSGQLVSAAQAEIPWRPGEQTLITLTLGCVAPAAALDSAAGCAAPSSVDGGALDATGDLSGTTGAEGAPDALSPVDIVAGRDQSAESVIADAREPGRDGGPGAGLDAQQPVDSPPPDAPVAPGTRLAEGLVLYFKLDEQAGSGTAADSSGHGNRGALANLDVSRAWAPGRFGRALELPGGSTAGWLSVAPSPSLNLVANGLSISVWVRAGPATAERSTIVARRSVGAGGFLYSLHLRGDRPGFWLNSSHGARAEGNSSRALPSDRWIHLALVHDEARLSARLYQDGDLVAASVSLLGFAPEVTPLIIGGSQGASASSIIDPFAGTVDEVAVYDRPLNVAEVRALAAGYQPR